MKTILALTLVTALNGYASLCLNKGVHAFSSLPASHQKTQTDVAPSGVAPSGIQQKAEQALAKSIRSKSPTELESLRKQFVSSEGNQNKEYWTSYIDYYLSVYHLFQKNQEQSERFIQQAISALEEKDDKNTEDHALLAIMKSFSIMFSPGMKAAFISAQVKEHAHKALALDDANVRAYYALANNDFYTPEMYGGGRKVEEYLKKAIALPDQTQQGAYMPSWGKDQSYAMLVRYYLKKEEVNTARKYYQEAVALYPESSELKSMQDKL